MTTSCISVFGEWVSRESNTEHQLLARRRRPRTEFVIVSQLEEAEFRERLDAWPSGIDLRVGALQATQKRSPCLCRGVEVYLIVRSLPLRIANSPDSRFLELTMGTITNQTFH